MSGYARQIAWWAFEHECARGPGCAGGGSSAGDRVYFGWAWSKGDERGSGAGFCCFPAAAECGELFLDLGVVNPDPRQESVFCVVLRDSGPAAGKAPRYQQRSAPDE